MKTRITNANLAQLMRPSRRGQRARPKGSRIERWLSAQFDCTLLDGGVGCPYLYRWVLWVSKRFGALYVHKFIADDWSRDLHDHSSRFVSIGLRGSYGEQMPSGMRIWRAPWARTFPATHTHRLLLRTPTVWTLVYAWPTQRISGFWINGKWFSSKRYRESERALAAKAC